MKLNKVLSEQGGYIISVTIGGRSNSSYWTSPPVYGKDNHHYNFEVEYLSRRYPIINTKAKANQFSSLYKNLWIEVAPYQLELMEHCIGIGRKKKPYRNYFCTQETDKDWNEFVEKGLAIKGRKGSNYNGLVHFWLTKQGVEFVMGKSVSDKVYGEL